MRKNKIRISFVKYSDANLETKAGLILKSMTGNPAFPDPVPTLVELQAAVTSYHEALVAAAELGRTNVANKNSIRQQLEGLLTRLGMYVMFIANGDEAILVSSGYTLVKTPEPRYISNPGIVTLANGITSGELVCSVPQVKGATSYQFGICAELPTDATVWANEPYTKSRFTFQGLVPGKQYWFRVAALGTGGQKAYSPVASVFAQ